MAKTRWYVGYKKHTLRLWLHEHRTESPQGELIEWRGFDPKTQRQWYGTRPESELCSRCWEASRCPREFSYGVEEHVGLLGVFPSGRDYARLLLERTRPWVEPAQSY